MARPIRLTVHGKRADTMLEIRIHEWNDRASVWMRVGQMTMTVKSWVLTWRHVFMAHPQHEIDESHAVRAIYQHDVTE